MSSKPTSEEIVRWFLKNYKEPVHGVPYNIAEGGYQYVNGGPYDATEEIEIQFPNADFKEVKEAVSIIENDGVKNWVKQSQY